MFIVPDLPILVGIAGAAIALAGFLLVQIGSIGIHHRTLREIFPDEPVSKFDYEGYFPFFDYLQRHGFDNNVSTVFAGWACILGGAATILKMDLLAGLLRPLLDGN